MKHSGISIDKLSPRYQEQVGAVLHASQPAKPSSREDLPPVPASGRPKATPPAKGQGMAGEVSGSWADWEDGILRVYYLQTPDSAFSLHKLVLLFGRSFASIALRASRLGITRPRLQMSDDARAKMSTSKKLAVAEGRIHPTPPTFTHETHPRGMRGKKHTAATKDKLSVAGQGKIVAPEVTERQLKTKLQKYGTLSPPRHKVSWKGGWRTIGGQKIYARSRWEANYARYLQFLKEQGQITKWEHEPETFWFSTILRGVRSYLPDFRVTLPSGALEYHEIKGWMDDRSKTKLKRMAKYHSTVRIKLADKHTMKALGKQLGKVIPDWETG